MQNISEFLSGEFDFFQKVLDSFQSIYQRPGFSYLYVLIAFDSSTTDEVWEDQSQRLQILQLQVL